MLAITLPYSNSPHSLIKCGRPVLASINEDNCLGFNTGNLLFVLNCFFFCMFYIK